MFLFKVSMVLNNKFTDKTFDQLIKLSYKLCYSMSSDNLIQENKSVKFFFILYLYVVVFLFH